MPVPELVRFDPPAERRLDLERLPLNFVLPALVEELKILAGDKFPTLSDLSVDFTVQRDGTSTLRFRAIR